MSECPGCEVCDLAIELIDARAETAVAERLAKQMLRLVDDVGAYSDDPAYLDGETRNLLHRLAAEQGVDPRPLEDR